MRQGGDQAGGLDLRESGQPDDFTTQNSERFVPAGRRGDCLAAPNRGRKTAKLSKQIGGGVVIITTKALFGEGANGIDGGP